jgi:glycerol-3-phosphate dehydrogenase
MEIASHAYPEPPARPDRLGPLEREAALDRLAAETFDLVIIGAGVVGAGAALDAATRGLSVAMIEQRDYASGTSSRSSKLIHGGLRYLEQLNFRLVMEALQERGLLLDKLAPHLIRPISFLYPLTHRVWERLYVGTGIMLYDLLAATGDNPLPRHRHLGKRRALEIMPGLDPSVLVGAIQYYDAQVDDARHTMILARTAAGHGAVMAPSVRATGLARGGNRVVGVEAHCLETGRRFTIRGHATLNATGVWTDSIQEMAGKPTLRVTASKGIHLVVPRDRIAGESGLITKTRTSVLFLIPWGDYWIIGTTDTPWALDLAHPAASRSDIDYLLSQANRVLAKSLTHADVTGVFAGLRPLLSGESDSTSKLSREHSVEINAPGLATVAGGKYTTYRPMAADAVDHVVPMIPGKVADSRTEDVLLLGADRYREVAARAGTLATAAGIPLAAVDHLISRYGSLTEEIVDAIAADPRLAEPLPGAPEYLKAEVWYAAAAEGALHLDDVLTRRTRISIETQDRGLEAAVPTAEIMGTVLGWDDAAVERELAHYRARVEAEIESQRMPDDQTADAARLGAPDVRTSGRV